MSGTNARSARRKGSAMPLVLGAVLLIAGGAGVVAVRMSGAAPEAPHGADGKPRPPSKPGAILLEPFLVNVSESSDGEPAEQARYLRVVMRIELDRADVAQAATEAGLENTRLRDRILVTLGGKAADGLRAFEGREALRAELREAIQPLFEDARVVDVYFLEFLVQ